MAKFLADAALDALLDVIITADRQFLCEGQPANYSDATTALGTGSGTAVADNAIDSGDWTKANGDVSGRKATIAQQTGVTIDVSGDPDHVAYVDDGGSVLLLVTTMTTQPVTAGNTASINAHKIEVADVT